MSRGGNPIALDLTHARDDLRDLRIAERETFVNRSRNRNAARLGILMMSTLAVRCASLAQSPPAYPSPTPVAATIITPFPTTISTATPAVTPSPSTQTPITPTGAITLTLWTTEDLASSATAAGRSLRNQLDAFGATDPNIRIDVALKKPYGKGGLLDLLVTTHAVVPARLPDLVMLDASQVPPAAEEGALQPLDDLLPADLKKDFFPFAFQVARYREQWVALPFSSDVEHLVYDRAAINPAPRTWNDVLRQKASLLLPLGGDDAFLLQYFALGATLSDASNQPAIDTGAATQVLNFFKLGHDQNLMPDAALGLKSADEVWPIFAAGQTAMAQVPASRYLGERDKLPPSLNAAFAPVPTRDGRSATLATAWAFAIPTNDPARQAAAARFIQWMIKAERIAPWLRTLHRLPASRSALSLAVDPPDYAAFIREELEHAAYVPPNAWDAKRSDALRAAIAAVLKGQTTPEEAPRSIIAVSK